jgi:predicted nucleic acid-binding protein
MPVRVFLDSNVLIYSVGDNEPRRQLAEELIAAGAVVSAQVIAETAAVLRRKFGLAPAAVLAILEAVLPRVECRPIDADTVRSALRLAERLGYSHYDSQILAAALAADCGILYSEDMQHGQVIDGKLTIVNPFAAVRP